MKEGSALSVTVLCVGKLRERFYADAAQEYLKRLSRLMPTEVVELPDEKEPTNPSPALNARRAKRSCATFCPRPTSSPCASKADSFPAKP